MSAYGFSMDTEPLVTETEIPDDYGRVYNTGGSFFLSDQTPESTAEVNYGSPDSTRSWTKMRREVKS